MHVPSSTRLRAFGLSLVLVLTSCGATPAGGPSEDAASPVVPPGFVLRAVGRATRVVDGDTLVVGAEERVRVLGINTPELRHDKLIVRDFARRARQETIAFVGQEQLVLLVGTPPTDVHGRTLAYVHRAGPQVATGASVGDDLAAHLLREGYAEVYPAPHPRLEAYRALAAQAREAGRGLWTPATERALNLIPGETVAAGDAHRHMGERVSVEGPVAAVRRTDKGLFVDVGPPGPQQFLAVVLQGQLPLFPPGIEEAWRGHDILVTGVVKDYRGRPEIVLTHPDQVVVVEGAGAAP